MAGPQSGFRKRLFGAVHAEAVKRGMDHDALHDMCSREFKVHSMGQLTDSQLEGIYRQWTGKTLRRRTHLPRRGDATKSKLDRLVSGEDLILLDQEFAKRDWGKSTQESFIRRQLRGRGVIRSYSDFARVLNGVRAMNRREEL